MWKQLPDILNALNRLGLEASITDSNFRQVEFCLTGPAPIIAALDAAVQKEFGSVHECVLDHDILTLGEESGTAVLAILRKMGRPQ